jgi:hypothetical protein
MFQLLFGGIINIFYHIFLEISTKKQNFSKKFTKKEKNYRNRKADRAFQAFSAASDLPKTRDGRGCGSEDTVSYYNII